MIRPPDVPEFAWPARFTYTYRWRVFGWLLEGHAKLREALTRVWPGGVRRALHLTERIAEIPFVIRGLELPPGSWVLDVGSRWSPLPLFLAAMGYRVVAVDLASFPIRGSGPDFVLADMRRPPFKEMAFDAGTIVSTLEHVGLGWYDPLRATDDDIRLMAGLRSLIRPNGRLVLTVPYGRPEEDRHQRAYDRERLGRAIDGWEVETERYAVRHGSMWRGGTEAEAAVARSIPEARAVAMLVLRRVG
jgi:SAM-dependent methyltransferase